MKNNEKYIKEISLNSAAGVGVILTRTREPFRAIEALREFAFSKDLPFGVWNVRDGWSISQPSDDPEVEPKTDKMVDPYKAIKRIKDIDADGLNKWDHGIYVMHAPHHWTSGKHPAVTECLRHYVRDFAESLTLRLIMVVPESENLPEELQHDIPIVDFDLPSKEEISEIYNYVLESSTPDGQEVPKMHSKTEQQTIVSSSSGMTQMEIEVALSKAIVENKPASNSGKDWHDIEFGKFNDSILRAKTDVVKQSEVLELMQGVNMAEVGGLEVFKEWVGVTAACLSPEALADGVDKAKGVVVVGPPGTGKTLLGKTCGNVLKRPLVRVDISKCFAGIVGQSEGKARSAIKQLEAMAPVVALIDEVDKALGGAHKGGGDSGVSQRVLGIFLTAMQESKADIFWVLTANRVGNLPSEMLRKGRMDEVFAVLPPNRSEREAVFRIHLKKRKVNPDTVEGLQSAVLSSRGYVSAEIEAAVKEAKKVSYSTGNPITGESLCHQLSMMKPISEAFPEDFQEMEKWAKNNARNASLPESDESSSVAPATRVRRRGLQTNN
jgi:SpoVK/Ycf46/Vps4 family AAA+-type ATPase